MMEPIYNKEKDLLPGVILDKESGKFEISGVSCPYDAFEFYDPIFKWLDEYVKNPLEKTVLDLKMSYFNTASAKFLLRIMTKLNKMSSLGNDVKIRWFYSDVDNDMKEEGEEFKNILNLKFEMIPVKTETNDTDDNFDTFMDDII